MWLSLRDNFIKTPRCQDIQTPAKDVKILKSCRPIVLACWCFFLSGCAAISFNPATGRKELILIPTAQEVVMGQGIHASLMKGNKISVDADMNARLHAIGARIATVSDRKDLKYNVYLIENQELNAFTVPGGSLYFHTELFNKLQTDDRIAAVVAHEIGHIAAKHTIKKFQLGIGIGLLSEILIESIDMNEKTRQLWRVGAGVSTGLILAAYSRREELEADRLAAKYLRLAGYDPYAMIESLRVLEVEEKKQGGGISVPVVMRTHPYIHERIRQLENYLNQEINGQRPTGNK